MGARIEYEPVPEGWIAPMEDLKDRVRDVGRKVERAVKGACESCGRKAKGRHRVKPRGWPNPVCQPA